MPVRIDHAVTSGTFSLDGATFDVDNNVWVVGDDDECIVIDAPHDADAILDLVAAAGWWRSSARMLMTITCAWHPSWPTRRGHLCSCIRRTRPCGR